MSVEPGHPWNLTRRALDGLLRRLDEQPETAAREYEAIRRRLITFFSLRRLHPAESLADETIDRVARRIEEGERIEHVRAYFHGVAMRVALESAKRQRRESMALEEHQLLQVNDAVLEGSDAHIACLERCIKTLPQENRSLIIAYYRAGRLSARAARKLLAERLGISHSALKVRAHRIRGHLEECLQRCLMDGKADH